MEMKERRFGQMRVQIFTTFPCYICGQDWYIHYIVHNLTHNIQKCASRLSKPLLSRLTCAVDSNYDHQLPCSLKQLTYWNVLQVPALYACWIDATSVAEKTLNLRYAVVPRI